MNKARRILFAYDAASVVFLALFVLSVFPCRYAYAYVDPSVMTYTIQALAGVAVALSAVLGVALRRTRKALMKAFNIDENAQKEVEPDIHRVDPSTGAIIGAEAEVQVASQGERKSERAPHSMAWPLRLALSLLSSVFLFGTVFVVAPFELVASNAKDLVFGLSDICGPMLLFSGLLALVLALVLSLFRGRAFNVANAVVVALGVCAYVQAMFLNSSLPSADGAAIVWSEYTTITVVSAVIWILIITVFVVLSIKRASICQAVSTFACVALIIIQGVGVGSLWADGSASADTEPEAEESVVVTEEGLFTVSEKSNVIVFVLDMFDTAQLEHLVETDASTLDAFDGFTFFRNSSGSMIPTRYAIPYLLTGELPHDDETFEDYLENRYSRSSFVGDIVDRGYSVGIYSDSVYAYKDSEYYGAEDFDGKTMNIHPIESGAEFDAFGAIKVLSKCSLYRDLPWIAKPAFWFYTDELNYGMRKISEGADYGAIPYTMNDAQYYEQLKNDSLRIDDGEETGAFRFIHLMGAHWPYTMTADAKVAPDGEETDIDQQTTGALYIVKEYLAQLKELGVYENSTIIVTADHGVWEATMGDITEASSPIMLVKPAGASSSPCSVSDSPTGHIDYAATVIEAVGGNSSEYGSTVFSDHDQGRVRYYYTTTHDGKMDGEVKEYEITGDVLDLENWKLTGKTWYYGK